MVFSTSPAWRALLKRKPKTLADCGWALPTQLLDPPEAESGRSRLGNPVPVVSAAARISSVSSSAASLPKCASNAKISALRLRILSPAAADTQPDLEIATQNKTPIFAIVFI